MANLKQLKCPSCGATLNQSSPYQLIVECPYCHQQVVNETFQSSGKDNKPRILEFSMKEDNVVKTMVNILVKDPSVPTDIFDKMKMTSIAKCYVPIYIFEGSYLAPWTAQIERYVERQRIGSDGKLEDYVETVFDYPSGEVAGNFSVNSLSSKDLYGLGLDLVGLQNITVNPSLLPYLSSISLNQNEEYEFLSPSGDSDSVWRESGESLAINVGIKAANLQAPGCKCSASCELKSTFFVYIPIWIIDYSYENESFNFISYAEQYNSITRPICEVKSAEPTKEQQHILNETKEKYGNDHSREIIILLLVALCELSLFIGQLFDIGFLVTLSRNGWFFWFILLGGILFVINAILFDARNPGLYNVEKDILEDIDKRTQLLRKKEKDLKRERSKYFLQCNYGANNNSKNGVFHTVDKKDSNNDVSQKSISNNHQTRNCIHCGKTINAEHLFCRYCGKKQIE